MRVARRSPLFRAIVPAAVLAAASLGAVASSGAAGPSAPQWQPRGVFALSLRHLFDVSCPTTSLCVAVGEPADGDGGLVLRSIDGGSTWAAVALPVAAPLLRAVSCPTATWCEAIGEGHAGDRGVVVLVGSSDGGAHWSTQYHGTLGGADALESLDCVGPATCLAAAAAGGVVTQLSTSDAGAHWTGGNPFAALHLTAVWGVSCSSSTVCVATGATASGSGWVGRTTDAGTSWTTQHLSASTRPTGPVACPTTTTCLAVTTTTGHRAGILRTTSGGSSWTFSALAGPAVAIAAIECPSPTACYLVGAGSGADGGAWLARSVDGGSTWRSLAAPSSGVAVEGISCAAPSVCVTIGLTATGSEQLLQLSGRQASLLATSVDVSTFARSIACTSALHCVAVGGVASDAGEAAGVLVTDDAGASWTVAQVAPGASQLFDVVCPTPATCMAAGVGFATARSDPFGLVLRTTDGGRRWRVVGHETVLRFLNGITCTGAATCLAYGEGPRVLRTTDGGAHWSVARPPRTIEVLDAVRCTTTKRCLAIGSDATTRARVLVSSDAGRTWRFSATLTNPLLSFYDAMSLTCPSARTCVAGGEGPKAGWLRWSADGGARWHEAHQPAGQHAVVSIDCRNPTFCLGAGFLSTRSFMLRSANGGRNWSWFPAPAGTTTLFGVACGASGCWATGTRANGSAELAALR